MAFVHGANSRLFLGNKHISGTTSGFTCSFDASLAETTNMLAGGSTFIPGLTNGELSFEGFIEQQVVGPAVTIQDAIRTASQTDSGALFTALPSGFTVGHPVFFCKADISGFEIESSVDDAVNFSVETQGDEGIDWGVLLHDYTSIDNTPDPFEGAAVDNGAATSNGGAAMLHVTSVTGTPTGITVTVQHSADNSVWTDLVAFTTFSAATGTSEFKTVAPATTVNRYVRVEVDFDGGTSPTVALVASFARR